MAERWKGEYIITEGTDATGKTTTANNLALHAFKVGHEVIRVDEPDSAYAFHPDLLNPDPQLTQEPLAPISAEQRRIIKDGSLARQAMTNVFLFSAARAENWHAVVRPALERGAWVIGARNYFSTLIYQGYAEGLSLELIEDITRKGMGEEYMTPDHLYILDIDDEAERARRIANRGPLETPDTFESRPDAFQKSLINGYRDIAKRRGITLTDASKNPNLITLDLWNDINDRIKRRAA